MNQTRETQNPEVAVKQEQEAQMQMQLDFQTKMQLDFSIANLKLQIMAMAMNMVKEGQVDKPVMEHYQDLKVEILGSPTT